MVGVFDVLFVAWWIVASFAVSKAAVARGRSRWLWFIWSLVLSPLLALLLLLAYPVEAALRKDVQ
jgi:hypothetical protein